MIIKGSGLMDAAIWKQLLADWKCLISEYQNAQHEQASRLDHRHYRLGVPSTIFAAVARLRKAEEYYLWM